MDGRLTVDQLGFGRMGFESPMRHLMKEQRHPAAYDLWMSRYLKLTFPNGFPVDEETPDPATLVPQPYVPIPREEWPQLTIGRILPTDRGMHINWYSNDWGFGVVTITERTEGGVVVDSDGHGPEFALHIIMKLIDSVDEWK
jgi:hypothetical protein